MLNGLAALTVVFGISVAQAQVPGNRGKADHDSQAAHQESGATQPSTATAQVKTASAKQEEKNNAKPYQWHELYAPANMPNWLLAFLAGWAGLMALKTLKTIQTQTRATEDAARAALLSAQAVIHAERAWLLIEPVDKPIAEAGYDFYWKIRNVGRTTAKMIETQTRCEVSQNPISIPPIPKYEPAVQLCGRIIPPGGDMEFKGYWEFWDGYRYRTFRDEFGTLNGLNLLAHGFVRYLSFGEVCESHFCSGSELIPGIKFRPRLDAPAEYTNHT